MIQYAIDVLTAQEVAGWAADRDDQANAVAVTLEFDDGARMSALADTYRADLQDAGIRDGKASFCFDLSDLKTFSPLKIIWFITADSTTARALSAGERSVWSVERQKQPFLGGHRYVLNCVLVLIIKNEARYLLEWIEYHRMIGVEHFIVFDNESTDDIGVILDFYVASGIVSLIRWPNFESVSADDRTRGWFEQDIAYTYAIRLLAGRTRWVGFLDIDEFLALASPYEQDLLGFLHSRAAPTVSLFWRMFGTSGHLTTPAGLVIESYRWRSQDVGYSASKVFVRPESVHRIENAHVAIVQTDVERPESRVSGIDANGRSVRGMNALTPQFDGATVHHYHTRSADEYQQKARRGWPKNTDYKTSQWEAALAEVDADNVEDPSLVRFADAVLHRIARYSRARERWQSDGRDQLLNNWMLTVPSSIVFHHEWVVLDANRRQLLGFICDVAQPDVRLNLQFVDDFGTVLATVFANQPSEAARAFRLAGGDYGFLVEFAPQTALWCRWERGLFRLDACDPGLPVGA